MGELLLCNEPLAEHPYFLEGIAWNIYSMEELCYFIESNIYLLDEQFMSEELCLWIKEEMKRSSLAEKLLSILKHKGFLADFVYLILKDTGYCSTDTIKQVVYILKQMQKKSRFECKKMRADHLMGMEKYLSSAYEYEKLLNSSEYAYQEQTLIGNIWHNLGTAYSHLFIFKEAANCYEQAFQRNQNEESLKQCLLCYGIMNQETAFFEIAEKYKASENLLNSVREAIYFAVSSEEIQQVYEDLNELFAISELDVKAKQRNELSKIILDWKEGYRKKICLF